MNKNLRILAVGSGLLVVSILSLGGCDWLTGGNVELCKGQSGQCCSIQTGDSAFASSCTTQNECIAKTDALPKTGKYPIMTYPLKNSYTGSDGCR